MSKWYFPVTRENGTKAEVGPYPDEDTANAQASDYATDYPNDTVGAADEKAEDYVPVFAQAQVYHDDGSKDVYYSDGSIVTVS